MNFCKTGSSDAWSVRHHTHTHHTFHPTLEKFCPTVPRLMLIGILGTEQPLLLDTKCTNDTGVSGTTKWLPWCRKTAALLTEINIFRIVFFSSVASNKYGNLTRRNSCQASLYPVLQKLMWIWYLYYYKFSYRNISNFFHHFLQTPKAILGT